MTTEDRKVAAYYSLGVSTYYITPKGEEGGGGWRFVICNALYEGKGVVFANVI